MGYKEQQFATIKINNILPEKQFFEVSDNNMFENVQPIIIPLPEPVLQEYWDKTKLRYELRVQMNQAVDSPAQYGQEFWFNKPDEIKFIPKNPYFVKLGGYVKVSCYIEEEIPYPSPLVPSAMTGQITDTLPNGDAAVRFDNDNNTHGTKSVWIDSDPPKPITVSKTAIKASVMGVKMSYPATIGKELETQATVNGRKLTYGTDYLWTGEKNNTFKWTTNANIKERDKLIVKYWADIEDASDEFDNKDAGGISMNTGVGGMLNLGDSVDLTVSIQPPQKSDTITPEQKKEVISWRETMSSGSSGSGGSSGGKDDFYIWQLKIPKLPFSDTVFAPQSQIPGYRRLDTYAADALMYGLYGPPHQTMSEEEPKIVQCDYNSLYEGETEIVALECPGGGNCWEYQGHNQVRIEAHSKHAPKHYHYYVFVSEFVPDSAPFQPDSNVIPL